MRAWDGTSGVQATNLRNEILSRLHGRPFPLSDGSTVVLTSRVLARAFGVGPEAIRVAAHRARREREALAHALARADDDG